MKPSFLFKRQNACISSEVIEDLHISDILTNNAISVLRSVCDRNVILERQAVFKYILTPVGKRAVSDLIDSLRELSKNCNLYRESILFIEKVFLNIKILENYIDVIEKINNLGSANTVICSIKTFWCNDEKVSVIRRIKESLNIIKPIIGSISVYDICISGDVWVTRDKSSVSFSDELLKNLESIGYKHSIIEQKLRPIDIELDGILRKLFENELNEIEQNLKEYKQLESEISDLTYYIDELEFYLEITELVEVAAGKQVPICFPTVSDEKIVNIYDAYDITLFAKQKYDIVPNDVSMIKDQFYFIIGPNSGGKTTYIRCVGVNLLLFLCGCPIFAYNATIYPFDCIYTHFPQDDQTHGKGRLDYKVERIESIMTNISADSFLICNEIFNGTTETIGLKLLMDLADRASKLEVFGFCVTHYSSIIQSSYPVLSVKTSDDDSNKRLYKIYRVYSKQQAKAIDIIKKYNMDYQSLIQNFKMIKE